MLSYNWMRGRDRDRVGVLPIVNDEHNQRNSTTKMFLCMITARDVYYRVLERNERGIPGAGIMIMRIQCS